MLQQVDTIVQRKTQVLTAQRQAQKIHTQLETCQKMIEHRLKNLNQLQILTEKHTMMDQMDMATQHVDPVVFQPIENFDMQFTKNDTTEKEIGLITSTSYEKATLKASPCHLNQPSTATLTLHSHNGSPFSFPPSLISSTLISPDHKHTIKCGITQTHPGEYNITFTPTTRQDQLLTVQVGGFDVPDSPFILTVIPTPEMRGKPVNVITGLNTPRGKAICDNGDIVVAEYSANCITVLKSEGSKVKSFGTEKLSWPRGVAVSTDGHILVTDEHRL